MRHLTICQIRDVDLSKSLPPLRQGGRRSESCRYTIENATIENADDYIGGHLVRVRGQLWEYGYREDLEPRTENLPLGQAWEPPVPMDWPVIKTYRLKRWIDAFLPWAKYEYYTKPADYGKMPWTTTIDVVVPVGSISGSVKAS